MLIKWATAYVDCMAEGWPGGNGKPLGLGDMSEVNGAIPGTSVGQPGHPANTHTNGYDIDIAYYQNGGDDNYLKSICEHTINGVEQYHCVGEATLLDKWRNALFLGTLMSSPRLRVIGVDGKVGAIMGDTMFALCNDGWIPEDGCKFSNYALAYETVDEGKGWYHFHHHHQHISLEGLSSSSFGLTLEEDGCLDNRCRAAKEWIETIVSQSVPGIAFSTPPKHHHPHP